MFSKLLTLSFFCLCALTSASQLEDKILFEIYKDTYNKSYNTCQEELIRFTNFQGNLHNIINHNQASTTWTQSVNQFADMSHLEFKTKYLQGKVEARPSIREIFEPDYSSTLPASLDWRTHGAVTPVKDQGQCGSCWSFSTTGSIESSWFLATGKLVTLSEQQLMDCSTPEGDHSCEGGWMDDAFHYVEINGGLCSEQEYPYTAKDGASCHSCNVSAVIDSFTDVPANNEDALQVALFQQPISIAVEADTWRFYSSGIFNGPCGTQLDHGVLLVGYGTENNQPYWLIKNSWSAEWGESGYIRIPRGTGSGNPGSCGIAMAASFPIAHRHRQMCKA